MYIYGGRAPSVEFQEIARAMSQGETQDLFRILPCQITDFDSTTSAVYVGGINTPHFAAGALQQLFVKHYFDLGWVEGGLVVPQICWAPASAAAGNVAWGLEWAIVAPNGTPSTPATLTATVATPGVTNQYTITELNSIDLSNYPIRSVLVGRLYRNGAADTYAGAVALLSFGLVLRYNAYASVFPDRRV